MDPSARKERGAYYTDPSIAEFLVRWAVRHSNDRVLDPCFGGGVFVQAATHRISSLGGRPAQSITGIELDPLTHRKTSEALSIHGDLPRLMCHDFFTLDASHLGHFSAVVGNPPFIRYQRFNGARRTLALRRASEAGVRLTALTSAWAPFLAHAVALLKPNGRLAMVAPTELCHAAYARPLLQFLGRRFRRVRVLTFARRIFPDLSEDTVLVLGEGYSRGQGDIRLVSLPDSAALNDRATKRLDGTPVEGDALGRGVVRLITHLLPERTRILYDSLAHLAGVSPLGAIASSGIGYVTGKNDFFHLSAAEAAQHRIPSEFLIPAIRRSAWLTGLSFTERDWRVFAKAGQKCRLLTLTGPRRDLPAAVKAYLETGQAQGVHEAYKCRTRDPWYKVPHVVVPDLFLSYMANARPALAVNDAQAVANNTLLCVRLHPLAGVAPHALAAGWWTSLAALSAEIEGHSLGGGMLKLEPGEAVKVLIPLPSSLLKGHLSRDLSSRLDVLVRRKAYAAALDLGDQEILRNGLGLSSEDCSMLRKGFTFLMDRRRDR